METLFAPPADMAAAIASIVDRLEPGDATRGQDVYRSAKAACSACHRMGYVGGNIGPELTKIGSSRSRTDFIEAIAFPSHRIAQGFVATSVLTDSDEVISGLVGFEDDTRIELIVSADKRVSVPKSEIVKRNLSSNSVMPSGIEKVLSNQELSDLVAYLETAK
jgi:putative heme-binding domain-containing protein